MPAEHSVIDRDTPYQFGAFLLFVGSFIFTIVVNPGLTNAVEQVLWHLAQGTFGVLTGRMGYILTRDLTDPADHNVRKTRVGDVLLVENPDGTWKTIPLRQNSPLPPVEETLRKMYQEDIHRQQTAVNPDNGHRERHIPEVQVLFEKTPKNK